MHVPISSSSSLLFSLLCLHHPCLTSRSAERAMRSRWLTTSVDINCAFARCFGSGKQLLGDLVADVTEDSCSETSIPWQLLERPCTLAPPPCLSFFLLRLSFSTHDLLSPPQRLIHHDDLYLSICFPPTQRRCAVERCIDCLTEAPEHCLTRESKDAAP